MKDKEYREHKQLYQLRELQQRGVKSKVWRLSKEQVKFLSKYFMIKPYSYAIKTQKMKNIFHIESRLLKDIHYAYKRGKFQLVKRLTEEELYFLKERGITCYPYQYTIFLS